MQSFDYSRPPQRVSLRNRKQGILFVNFLHDYYQKMSSTAITYLRNETVYTVPFPFPLQTPESTVKSIFGFLPLRLTF
jgi:hypothetical protein